MQARAAASAQILPANDRVSCARIRFQSGEGGIRTPKPVSQFNGLANRKRSDVSSNQDKHLRPISDDLSTGLHTDTCPTDPMLNEVVDAWKNLPEAIKAGFLAMVRAASK